MSGPCRNWTSNREERLSTKRVFLERVPFRLFCLTPHLSKFFIWFIIGHCIPMQAYLLSGRPLPPETLWRDADQLKALDLHWPPEKPTGPDVLKSGSCDESR